MASNINPYNINGAFPVAGQDNSSQGFRDNFTNIKNNLLFAQNEINDLQGKALLTGALNGQSLNNDMAGAVIRRPQLSAWTQSLYDLGAISTSATLDFNQANFQKITTAGSINLDFANWPTSTGTGALGYGSMRVWIVITNTAHTITLPASVSVGVTEIAGYNPNNQTVTFDSTGNYIFDFSSIDGGNNYLIFDATRNHATFRDPSFYLNLIDTLNPTLFIGYNAGLSTAQQFEVGQDAVSTLGSYNSVSVGSLSRANVAYTQMENGGIAGYSVSSARGNIQLGNIQPVQNKDLIGYVNSIAYTGTGTAGANTFQQIASIDFFATGNASATSYTNGIGGNIAFFTSKDGEVGINSITQAVGIENDQSTRFYGNVTIDGSILGNLDVSNATVTTLNTNASVVFNNFSGEIIVNRIDNGNVYKFLVGGGRACLMGSTDSGWTYANSAPSANVTIDGSVRMEYLTTPSRYVFTNLGGSVEHHFFGIKTRNSA